MEIRLYNIWKCGVTGDQTNQDGIISFRLPEGTYKFRGDYQSNQYWATEALTAHQVNVVNLSTGGGSFTLSVEKESGILLIDIPVYVFSSSGSYLGINARTDDQGEVTFDLADGDYKFRADYFGYQFWSNDYTVPGTLSDVLTIAHQDVTVTVNQVYGVDIDPLEGVNVYLFTGSGSYQGIYQATDSNGQVTFNLPEKDYKVRADYLSGQYWSDVFSWQDVGVDIDHGTAILHVTHNGQDLYDVPVYLFTASGSYLSRLERTDSSSQVQFLLPADSYKFRVDYEGIQYWSDVISIIPHEENNIDLQLDLLADLTNDPSPDRFDGVPPVYEPEKIMVASLGSIRSLLVHSVVGQTTGGQEIYYFINDHLGTPQKLLNESADVVWSADYMPFGDADIFANTFENRFRFPGQYYDTESGLHYNLNRYYDPKLGRYLRADPIGLYGGINLYSYADQNPINAIDPFGLARYYVSYTIKSYSAVVAPAGMSKIAGLVVSTQRNPDGTYNAVRFEGKLYGAALGPLPWATTINNEEYFEDDCEKADVKNIEGKSWYLSGSMALWQLGVSGGGYKFGNLMGTKETPSGAEGLDFGVDFMMGRTWTVGPMLKYDAGIFPENR